MRLGQFFKDKKVLMTGHTGFKGAWLAEWLSLYGADLMGVSLEPSTTPNLFEKSRASIDSRIIDIRDRENLYKAFDEFSPEIVFHLAAQPLVRYSYKNPIETYETNVMGTLNVLEASRRVETAAIVLVTTDKCYENKEWVWGYRENDPMGGHDPYSSSKGCAELLISSYRNSYFNPKEYGNSHKTLIASARAGNVIGGGDWSDDRLIPDIVKSAHKKEKVQIRSPRATRPWQHVLEPLRGYLMLAQKLYEGDINFAQGWNFGPEDELNLEVLEMIQLLQENWPEIEYEVKENAGLHEANLLKLDCSKAKAKLGWRPHLNATETLSMTSQWYKEFYQNENIITQKQISDYLKLCGLGK